MSDIPINSRAGGISAVLLDNRHCKIEMQTTIDGRAVNCVIYLAPADARRFALKLVHLTCNRDA